MVDVLVADSPGLAAVLGPAQWGIFKQDGTPVLTTNSVASVEYARDYQISTAYQEKGAFASYNHVQVPYQAKVTFLAGDTRREALNALDAALASLEFVTLVLPEISYGSANLVHADYRREARRGATLVRINCWLEEVRVIPGPQQNNTQSTDGASTSQSGQVQAIDAGTTDNDSTLQLPPLDPPT